MLSCGTFNRSRFVLLAVTFHKANKKNDDMENRLDEDHKLSQGTYGFEKHQEGLGKPDLCNVNQETEAGQVELVVELEEPSELSMTVGEGDTKFGISRR